MYLRNLEKGTFKKGLKEVKPKRSREKILHEWTDSVELQR